MRHRHPRRGRPHPLDPRRRRRSLQPRPHLPEGGGAPGRARGPGSAAPAAAPARRATGRRSPGTRRSTRRPSAWPRSRRRTAATRSPSTRATRPSTTTARSLFGQVLPAQPGHAQPLLGDVRGPAPAHAGVAARCSATSSCCRCPTSTAPGYFLVLGANPLASNGSLMTAPGIERRLKELRARGGRLVVVDPAAHRDGGARRPARVHPPGHRRAARCSALLHMLFAEGLARPGRAGRVHRRARRRRARWSRRSRPRAVASATGVAGGRRSAQLAREFAARRGRGRYGRVGVSTQEFGGLASLAHQRRSTSSPATSTARAARCSRGRRSTSSRSPRASGQRGHFDKGRSRVRGLPEFGGEYPVAALAEEIETPGAGPDPRARDVRRQPRAVDAQRRAGSTAPWPGSSSWSRSTST